MITNDRIIAQNTLNALANEIEGHLLQILNPYQGLKIRKISGHGGYVAKLQDQFHRYCKDYGYNQPGQPYWVSVYASYTSLVARVSNNTTTAKPVEMYLGRFDDQTGILNRLCEGVKRRTDYTLVEVEGALARASQLEDEARRLRSSVSDLTQR